MKVAIQGIKASFHDVAARQYFKSSDVVPVKCATFRKLCEVLAANQSEWALMAIENSIAGSILPNYSLLEKFGFKISGEIYLKIEMNIMALPGQKISDLNFVQSHPMALFQCEDFLQQHSHMKVLEAVDTAESAKFIHDNKLKGYGAIASGLAAEMYGLEILEAGIETNKLNFTRFLVISTQEKKIEGANKTSLMFQTPHKPGSLVTVLNIFQRFGLNMTKIQSVPVIGKPSEYSFHVDLDWENQKDHDTALREIGSKTTHMINFGNYKRGERPWM